MPVYRGTLVSYDGATATATVRLDDSPVNAMTGIKVNRGLAAAELVANRRVIVDTGDHSDPADAVLTAVY